MRLPPRVALCARLLSLSLCWTAPQAWSQSACSSDGQPPLRQLQERFMDADCESCWTQAPPALRWHFPPAVAVDWILPAASGEDAPLATVAKLEGQDRLAHLGLNLHDGAQTHEQLIQRSAWHLRVAQGPAVNDYLGVSVQLRLPRTVRNAQVWLLLVETIPADEEGTPVIRNLVRQVLRPDWVGRERLQGYYRTLEDTRTMAIPEGARPERLSLIAWAEDGKKRIQTMVRSVCENPPEDHQKP